MRKTLKRARFISLMLAAMLMASGCGAKAANTAETPNIAGTTETSDNTANVYVIPEEDKHVLSEEANLALMDVKGAIQNVYDTNGIIRVIVGLGQDGELNTDDDDYILQMYNKDRQCYSEASNSLISLYYDKGKSIMFTDKVTQVSDLTILDLLQAGIELCEAGVEGCTVDVNEHSVTAGDLEEEETTTAEETTAEQATEEATAKDATAEQATEENTTTEQEVTEPTITETQTERTEEETTEPDEVIWTEKVVTLKITGLDNIKKMYGLYSLDNAQSVVDSWESMYEFNSAVEETTAATDGAKVETAETTAETKASTDDNKNLEEARKNDYMSFEIYVTDDGVLSVGCKMSVQGTLYTSWYFDGYVELDNWSIGDGWKEGLTDEEYLNLISKVQDNLNEVITKFNSNNTEVPSETEANSATEGITDETTEATDEESEEVIEPSLAGPDIYETVEWADSTDITTAETTAEAGN